MKKIILFMALLILVACTSTSQTKENKNLPQENQVPPNNNVIFIYDSFQKNCNDDESCINTMVKLCEDTNGQRQTQCGGSGNDPLAECVGIYYCDCKDKYWNFAFGCIDLPDAIVLKECSSNDNCSIVETECCKCPYAINKKFELMWEESKNEDECYLMDCESCQPKPLNGEYNAICVEQKCTVEPVVFS